jgi:uncharacterized delta-60 repeat protein
MIISNIKWLHRLLLTSIYALGVLGIVGSGGGSSGSGLCDDGACDCVQDLYACEVVLAGTAPYVASLAVALDSSDDVYVGGGFTTFKNSAANRIARLNNDGSLDTGFVTGTGFTSTVITIAPANDGSGDVYVGGDFTSYDGTPVGYIARLNLDGTLDTFFDTGTGFNYGVRIIAAAIDGSGDVYVGGSFTNYNGMAVGPGLIRLNDDGSIDAGFSAGSGWGEAGIALATDGSGDVYVTRSRSPGIARLNDDGSIDTGFDTGLSGFNDGVRVIAAATDGSDDIYAGGYFGNYNGMGTNDLARLNSDGSLDSGFVTSAGFGSEIYLITPAIDGSGDVYVGGGFRNYNGMAVGHIARLNLDGTLDTNFATGTGFNNTTTSVALATDGSGDVYVGGYFTSYKSSPAAYMARLTAGGAFVR